MAVFVNSDITPPPVMMCVCVSVGVCVFVCFVLFLYYEEFSLVWV